MFFSRIIWKEILYYSSTFFSGLFKDKDNFSGITQCAFPTIVKSRPRHQLEIMHQSIPAAPTHPPPPPHHPRLLRSICPPCQSRGGAFANFALLGARHLSTPGPAPNFWQASGFLSEYTYTEDFNGKTSRLAHLSRRRKNCKGMFSIWCMHLFIAY